MLETLRRQSVLIYVIFGAIILIFGLSYGPGGGSCAAKTQKKQWVARVNGTPIEPELFFYAYMARLESWRRGAEASGIAFDRALAERAGIRRIVVDDLVTRQLLVAESEARGVHVSDERLRDHLRGRVGFEAGSYDAYEREIAQRLNMKVEQFERMMREDMATRLLEHALTSAVDVTDDELKQIFVRENERIKLRYVRFPIDRKSVPVPGEQAVATLLEHEPYALQAQYDQDIADFATPAMVRAEQIVRVLPADASSEAVDAAKQELVAIKAKLEQGEAFAALAAAHSQDEVSRAKGGDMGFVKAGDLDAKLTEALFAMPDDTLSDAPIRTRQGLHLLHKSEERPAGRKQLDDIRPELAVRVLQGRLATAKAKQAAEAMIDKLVEKKATLAALSRPANEERLKLSHAQPSSKGLPLAYESAWLLRTDTSVGALGEVPALVAAVFGGAGGAGLTAPDDILREPFVTEDAVVVVTLKERTRAEADKFREAQSELFASVVQQKQARVMNAWTAQLRSQAKVVLNPAFLTPAMPPAPAAGEGVETSEGEAPAAG